jgi:hypothetical protein
MGNDSVQSPVLNPIRFLHHFAVNDFAKKPSQLVRSA